MGESDDRVQDALASYLDYLEMGGPKPNTSHLSGPEQQELNDLIEALEMTEGVPFGHGRREEGYREQPSSPAASKVAGVVHPEQAEAVLSQLREELPPGVRIEADPSTFVSEVGAIAIVRGWIVGTFGGRVRVWLLDTDTAQTIEKNRECLTDLNLVFRMFPETAAVALVAGDLSCLVVEPEDCGPQIEVPSGSLVSRRYRRSIRSVGEAVSALLEELNPYWDPVPAFDSDAGLHIDVSVIGQEFARVAIERQRGIGERARKGNPKKDALLALGGKEISGLTRLANGLFDGSLTSEEAESRIEGLAKDR